jgi:hypothetical protein
MDPVKFRGGKGPEAKIQDAFIKFLEERGWHAERMIGIGSTQQQQRGTQVGIPDLYIMHPVYGQRWVDLKNPGKYEFTKAQKQKWPLWEKFGCPIWIITAATEEEYDKLFKPCNWRCYWKEKYDLEKQELEDTLEFLYDEYQSDNS